MYKRLIVLFLIIASSYRLYAQGEITLSSVDEKTYALWLAADWKNLITEGENALNKHVDFYYLRVRLGIAYFETHNYHKAIENFGIAYSGNTDDVYLKEVLYYAYLYSGRESEALVIAATFPESLKSKTGYQGIKNLSQIDFTFNANFLGNTSVTDNYNNNLLVRVSPTAIGSQFISKSHAYFNFNLKHQLTPKFSIYHGLTYMDKTYFQYYQYIDLTSSSGAVTKVTTPSYSTKILQYYASGNLRIAKGFNLLFGAQVININYTIASLIASQTISKSKTDYLAFVSAYKSFNYITIGTSAYYAKLNSATQIQNDFMLTYYPFGNLNLYTVSTFSMQTEMSSTLSNAHRTVFDQLIGGKLTKKLWAEAYATVGTLTNFIRNDGFVVYNGIGAIKNRFGGKLILGINSHLQFNLDYSMLTTESVFNLNPVTNTTYNKITYNNQSITGGVKWKF